MKPMNCLAWVLVPLFFSVWPDVAFTQAYPQSTIRIVVPYPPGGGVDVLARLVGNALEKDLSWKVVVDNRSGAAGSVGADIVAKAAPDGYTLLVTTNGPWLWGQLLHSLSPSAYDISSPDPLKLFAPITLASSGPYALAVNPSIPATTVQQLVALAKAAPGKFTFASAGLGSQTHLAGELFRKIAKVDILHVPYRGSPAAVTDLLAGRVSMAFQVLPLTLPYSRVGKLKVLAVTTATRFPSAPDVPTMEESGFSGFDVSQWSGFLAPAGTPDAVLDKLQNEIVRILKKEDVRELLLQQGFEPAGTTREEFRTFLLNEIKKSATIIMDSGVRITSN